MTKEKPLTVSGKDRKLVADAARMSGLSEKQFVSRAIREAVLNTRVPVPLQGTVTWRSASRTSPKSASTAEPGT